MMRAAAQPAGRDAGAVSRLIWWGALLLVVYSVWVWAGLRPSFHRFAFYGSLPLAALLLLGGPAAARRAVWRDVVFWLGFLFNAYLLLQWSNAGRELVLDATLNQWVYTDPPRPGWPYAFDRDEAWQMITWFFPAWILVSALRSPHIGRSSARTFLLALVISAGLLALFGLIQYQSGTKNVYWSAPFGTRFFASFTYRNHAASFFGLMAAVAAGIFLKRYLSSSFVKGRATSLSVCVATFILCLMAMVFSGSRAAVFFAAAMAMLVVTYGMLVVWRHGSRVQRLHALGGVLVISIAAALALSSFGKDALVSEFFGSGTYRKVTGEVIRKTGELDLYFSADVRLLQARIAKEMWLDQPWFGVGGWGYKYLAYRYLPEDQWWVIKRSGFANVHVDLLQFLAEFGVIGFLPLVGIGWVMVQSLSAGVLRRDPLVFMGLAGLGLVLFHSMIDIPFRSPGLLYHWLAVLALLPPAVSTTRKTLCCISQPK